MKRGKKDNPLNHFYNMVIIRNEDEVKTPPGGMKTIIYEMHDCPCYPGLWELPTPTPLKLTF
jgi:hypothetical protein